MVPGHVNRTSQGAWTENESSSTYHQAKAHFKISIKIITDWWQNESGD